MYFIFLGSAALHRRLRKGVIPSLFSWKDEASPQDLAREQRVMNRGTKRKLLLDLTASMDQDDEDSCNVLVPEIGLDVEITNDDATSTVENESVPSDSNVQQVSSNSLSTQTPSYPMFSIDNFIHDDAGINFYTGLENHDRFQFVLRTLGPAAYS